MRSEKTIVVFVAVLSLFSYCRKQERTQITEFTRLDSVTHLYLDFKDSLMDTWNRLTYEENRRVALLKDLLHELERARPELTGLIQNLILRTEQLPGIRFTPKTISNPDVVEEYDLAVNSITTEVMALVANAPAYAGDAYLQNLVAELRNSEQLIASYRNAYDRLAMRYNAFLDAHLDLLKEIDRDAAADRRALFQTPEE
jgi:hypothetical protein